jgi:membrane-associated protease RseP (regulator of RpoE activity)
MHSLLAELSFSDTLLLAAWSPLGVWSAVWPYLLMLAGFSVIIFVHELGHFVMAKWAGVRVEKFAIGFGREVFGFTRGETRYSFNILPLGGYVKMLGQEDFDDKAKELRFKDDPRSFVNKPVRHRMAIVSAGVIMNIAFACVLFAIVFSIGMEAEAPRIAYVEPDSPADKGGLLPGDNIHEINGERILDFKQVTVAVLLAPPHRPIQFIVERGDGIHTVPVTPEMRRPESMRDAQRLMVGIQNGVTREIARVAVGTDPSDPNQPRVGDMLVEVDGIEVTDANVNEILLMLAHSTGDVYVERKDPDRPDEPPQRIRVEIPLRLAIHPSNMRDSASVSILGLTPLVRFSNVHPKGRAALAGLEEGDTVLSWGDAVYPNDAAISRAVRDHAEYDIPFSVRKPDGRVMRGFVRPKRNKRGPASIQARCEPIDHAEQSETGPKARFVSVRPFGRAYDAGIESGDVILRCNDLQNPDSNNLTRLIREKVGRALTLTVQKPDGRALTALVRPGAPGSIDARYTAIAEDLLQIGQIVPTIDGKPSPAAEAGIPSGVRIVGVNGHDVSKWGELIDAFRAAADTAVELAYEDAEGNQHIVPFRVPHCIRTRLGLGPEARIVRIEGRDTVETQTSRGIEKLSVRYRAGTKAILRELIGQKDVPVEFRRNPLAPIETEYIDVTADMVDPWLARIAFAPNIELFPETTLVKGENALDAIWIGIYKTYYFVKQVYEILHRMVFTRSVGVDTVAGPLGIVSLGGAIARTGLVEFLFFMAIISANLAVINFLPLPIVDGGLMIFLIIEKIKGSPVSLRVQIATQMLGLFLIIGAFIFFTYQDLMRLLA